MLRKHSIPAELLDRLEYDPNTGIFRWRADAKLGRRADRAGCVAGHVHLKERYVRITYKRVIYSAAVLAWRIMHGVEPELEMDHINGNPTDNRLCNLRLATRAQNLVNTKARKNSSGIKGVSWYAAGKKWRAQIKVNGKTHYLGAYSSKEEAAEKYRAASLKLHGEFSSALR